MADSTTLEGFPVPLATNSGWRPDNVQGAFLGNFIVTRTWQVLYKQVYITEDATYGQAVHATAAAAASSEAAAAIAAMP
jgi:hypothetical protein